MQPPRADAVFSRVLAVAALVIVSLAVGIAFATAGTSDGTAPELVVSVADRVRIAAATASTALWLVLAATLVARFRSGTPDPGTRALLSVAASVVLVAAGAGTVSSLLAYGGSFFVPVAFGRISAATAATQTAVCAALLWWIRSDEPGMEEPSDAEPDPVELQP